MSAEVSSEQLARGREAGSPWIPTFPPAFSHEMSCSKHSEAICSRSRAADLLLASKKLAD